jgi:hydrogenase nickel incorporation protein HypA/HybF
MQAALEIAFEHAAGRGARTVHRIGLRIGPLAGIVPEALEFAFDVLTRGTIAETAELVVEPVPIDYQCAACGREFSAPEIVLDCPKCQGILDRSRGGRELEVAYVEVS